MGPVGVDAFFSFGWSTLELPLLLLLSLPLLPLPPFPPNPPEFTGASEEVNEMMNDPSSEAVLKSEKSEPPDAESDAVKVISWKDRPSVSPLYVV
ncbi:hypothetical protein RRF57_005029 [Xylaria bambusicola]|uniref:Uncharacterized protein n=1 Tax=Xylaria bambusicola TaxID=326684 RepID=A0AAN7YXF6_9PEZI